MSKKSMTLDILSNIKGAKESEVINQFFDIIKNTKNLTHSNISKLDIVPLNQLRKDQILKASISEIQLIKQNFPQEKNGFLVVSKTIKY